MPDDRFDVFFSGVCLPGQDPDAVRERVRRLFKTSDAQLTALFSGQPVAVKKSLDMDAAGKFRVAFRDIGALVTIRRSSESSSKPAPSQAQNVPPSSPEPAGMVLLPPRSGTLEAFAPRVTPAIIPDISALNMDDSRRPLDETPPPPPLVVDTHGLSMVSGNGSMADCAVPIPPQAIPNIDYLTLSAPETAAKARFGD
ncbi:MAG: hypothetical protein WCP34_06910 [Pseudomonadota bacterium]